MSSEENIQPGTLIRLKSDHVNADVDDFVSATVGCISIHDTLEVPDFITNQFLLNHADLARLPIGSLGLVVKKTESQEMIPKKENYDDFMERTGVVGINLDKSNFPYIIYDWYAVYFDSNQFHQIKNEHKNTRAPSSVPSFPGVKWAERMKTGIYLCINSSLELC